MVESSNQYAEQIQREEHRRRKNRIGPLRLLTAQARRLPDFVIIGAQKCGTTALYNYVAEHPDVAPSLTKEIHFFDNHFHRGERWYKAHFPTRRFGSHRMCGEASPAYLLHPTAPRRMAECLPEARLIVLVRNPSDRAYSHFQHNVRKGRESLGFEESFEIELERLASGITPMLDDEAYFQHYHQYSYLLRGCYAAQLARWFKHFHHDRVLILECRDLLMEPATTFRTTLEFLGLSPFEPDYKIHHHYGYSKIDPSLRTRLVEFFKPHNERLYELVGQDFGWD